MITLAVHSYPSPSPCVIRFVARYSQISQQTRRVHRIIPRLLRCRVFGDNFGRWNHVAQDGTLDIAGCILEAREQQLA